MPKTCNNRSEQDFVFSEEAPFNSTAIAFGDLRSQLGLSLSSSQYGAFFSEFLSSFPLLNEELQRTFWRNRNVLEVSLHIDNMLALTSGSQNSFMIGKKRATSQRIGKALKSLTGGRAFMCQLKSEDSDFSVLQQRMIFLGCNMECLRSSLATWVYHNPNYADSVWKPSLDGGGGSGLESFSFRTSDSFANCMRGDDWDVLMGERYIQMRLLWEPKNYLLNMLPAEGISPERPEAIILCLLSFPAIQCTIVEVEEDTHVKSVNSCEGVAVAMDQRVQFVHVSLSVPFGRQPIYVAAHLQSDGAGSIEAIASLCGEGEFLWESWRDDFISRLAGASEWQRQNGLSFSSVAKTEQSIAEGRRTA